MARRRLPLTPKSRGAGHPGPPPGRSVSDTTAPLGHGFVLLSEASSPRPALVVAFAGREGLPSMEPRIAATRVPDPDAADFIRFCYRRRRVGWPELYDEMCAVAARGLFRGLGTDDLAAHGIGFSLFDMPALAEMSSGIVAEEQALQRPTTVVLALVEPAADEAVTVASAPAEAARSGERRTRFAAVPAGA